MWGYLEFSFSPGKNPKPFFPITAPSSILTLLPIIVFLIRTLLPIIQSVPIFTFDSIILLCPIIEYCPIFTFSPNKTFFPNFIFENFFKSGFFTLKSTASSKEFG